MNTNFGQLKLKIIRALSDEALEDTPIGGATYSADLLKDSVHAALDAITQRIWKPITIETEGNIESIELEDGVLDVEAVYETDLGIFLPRISMRVGNTLSSTTGNGWLLYPNNILTFINAIGTTGSVLYCSSLWTKPDKDSDLIEAPAQTLTCLILYASSFCLLADSTSSASIDRFKTKVDSGAPTDNPAKEMSDFFLRRFEFELQRLPSMEKGRTQ